MLTAKEFFGAMQDIACALNAPAVVAPPPPPRCPYCAKAVAACGCGACK